MELAPAWLPTLAAHCAKRGVHFLCTPFDEEWVELLDRHVPAFKLASYEMSHLPLARAVLAKKKPVFASTGAHTIDEVKPLSTWPARSATPRWWCCSARRRIRRPGGGERARDRHPARGHRRPRRALRPLARPDHRTGGGGGAGASVIEKHFTLSNRLPGPDQKFAVEPHELRQLVKSVRAAEMVLGTGDKKLQPVEQELRQFARRSVFAVRAIRRGDAFSADNVGVLRNGVNAPGLPPRPIRACSDGGR